MLKEFYIKMNEAKKVLMIDDDDDLRMLVGLYIKSVGYEVFEATNGEDAKEKLKTLNPDLIILDMMMPVLDGMGFLHWLRKDAKQDTPVLAFTSLDKSEIEDGVQALGGTIVFKPIDLDKLVERIQKILE
jgi:OmpR family response regulator RpaB